jgi:hypothetical protein
MGGKTAGAGNFLPLRPDTLSGMTSDATPLGGNQPNHAGSDRHERGGFGKYSTGTSVRLALFFIPLALSAQSVTSKWYTQPRRATPKRKPTMLDTRKRFGRKRNPDDHFESANLDLWGFYSRAGSVQLHRWSRNAKFSTFYLPIRWKAHIHIFQRNDARNRTGNT